VIILTTVWGIKMEMQIRIDLGQGLVVCCCECGDELSDYKNRIFLGWLSNC